MKRWTAAVVLVLVAAVGVGVWRCRGGGSSGDAGAIRTGAGTSGGTSAAGGGGGAAGDRAPGSPAPARLQGRVLATGGAPLGGAIVHVVGDDGEPVAVAAGSAGQFVVDGLEAGDLGVSASAPGHLPKVERVTLRAGETRKLDFTLDRGGFTLRGQVMDAQGGPIGGAIVSAAPRHGLMDGGDDGAAALTDADGTYAMTVARGRHRVLATHPEYVGVASGIDITGDATLDFTLIPGGVVEGTVVDLASGDPVADATVIVSHEGGGGWAEARARATARSDARGHFRVPGLEPGTLRIRAEVERDGRVSRDPVIVPLGIAEQAAGIEVLVAAAPYVGGRVVDEQGAPVADATVVAMATTELTTTRTDGDGNFRFIALRPGTWRLTATGARYHMDGDPVPVTLADAPVTGVTLKVAAAPHITGRVEPAEIAEVSVEREMKGFMMMGPGGFAALEGTQTGPDGRFDISPVEPGKRTVIAKAPDGRRGKATVEVPEKGAADVVIRLEDAGSIAGRVVDQAGAPVAAAAVHVKRIEAGKRSTVVINGLDITADRAPTAADGSFQMRGLEAGNYELTVFDEHGGRLRWARPQKGKDKAPVALALGDQEQKRGVELAVAIDDAVLRGIVRGPDGAPKPDAYVTAILSLDELRPEPPGEGGAREESTTVMVMHDGRGAGGVAPVLTDDRGRFEIRGLRRGTYDVIAEADRGALRGRVSGAVTGSEVTVALTGLAEITGTVTAGGKPLTEFTVHVEGVITRQQPVRDAGGKFRIPRLEPGAYTVRVTSAAGAGKTTTTAIAGTSVDVTIAVSSPARVRGKLVDSAGKPIAGTPVLAMPVRAPGEHGSFTFEGEPPSTGPDGTFELEVAPGEYELLLIGRPSPRLDQRFTVTTGQVLDLGTITVPD